MLIIKKQTSKVVHGGAEAWDGMHPLCNTSDGVGWVLQEESTAVTCKKCLKHIEKAEHLGLHLEVRHNEDGSSRVVDTRDEIAEQAAYIEDGLKADADAGTYSYTNEVAILRDAPGRAIVTAAFDGQTVGGSIVRKGKRLVLVAGTVTVTGNSFEKVAKLFAMKLGFRADRIEVARGF